MKVFKIVLFSFLSLIAGVCIIVVIGIKTFNINKYKPQIIEQAKKILNRDINFNRADLDISFTHGISLNILDLALGENPEFGKADFLKIKRISLTVDVIGYITKKKIYVSNILIDSPSLTVIRRKDGAINAANFGQPAAAGTIVSNSNPAQALFVVPAILVSSLKIDNGTVKYVDDLFEPAMVVDVEELGAIVNNISLTDPFAFSVQATVLSAKKNIKLAGKAQINLSKNEISIFDLSADTDLSAIIIEKISQEFPITKGAVLPSSIQGKVDVKLDKVVAGPKGLGVLNARMALSGGVLQFRELASALKDIKATASLTQSDMVIDKGALAIGEGMINYSGSLQDYLLKQRYSMTVDIKNLKIQDLIVQDKAPIQVEGILSGPASVEGQGFTAESFNSNLSGRADISLVKTKLKGLNVLRMVLDKLSVIPGMSENLENGLPDSLKQRLQQKDTDFSDIKLPVVIENGRIFVKNTVIESAEFIFKGQAEAAFDGAYSLEGSFLIPQELSSVFVSCVSQLQYLLNDQKQIEIPLKVSGTGANVNFHLDANYIGKKLLANQATQRIFDALDKALGTPKPASATDQGPSQQNPGDNNAAVKNTISSILGDILKK